MAMHESAKAPPRKLLECQNLKKTFSQGGEKIHVLDGISLNLHVAETMALVGPSGSGKTTLLQILGLLEQPDSGTIKMEMRDVSRISDQMRTQIRGQKLGFVYQYHHLLPECSAIENVMMPLLLAGSNKRDSYNHALKLLGRLGLSNRLHHRPAELSGGQQQRVAIARALVNRPSIVLADEPTGNLDHHTAEQVMELFLEAASDHHTAIIMVTHNMELASRMQRHVRLEDGQIQV